MRIARLDMGTFNVELEIGDPDGQRFERVEALVDSGATHTFLPSALLDGLGVVPWREETFELADGTLIHRNIGLTRVRLNGSEGVAPVVFGGDEVAPLLGAVTLEIFGFGIDPMKRRLIRVNSLV